MRAIGSIVVTAVLVSAFWIFFFNIRGASSDTEASPSAQSKPVIEDDPANVVVGPAGLAIPVRGVRGDELVDTFTQARAGGARVHDAIDIMAEAGTPVIAAAAGKVEKLFYSEGGGGITAYVRSPDQRWTYYYAHLQDYAPGLKEGQNVKRGDMIGFVGSTGNANPDGPHLHFAINRMEPGEAWHEGTPINPYPLLAGKGDAR